MSAVKGYKCIITISEKVSAEKEQILRALGATVIRAKDRVPIDSPHSIFSMARRLQKEIPNSCILDQYTNPENPKAHEFGTAEEIWCQTQGKVNVLIAGAGTGGTITGTARGLKKHNPTVLVVGVDPVGSILAVPDALNKVEAEYNVEGIGCDFIPEVLDQSAVDVWAKVTDQESFQFARRLVREEGILCGGSSGATIAALGQLMTKRPELNADDKVIVVMIADGLQNYLTEFANDGWMMQNGYIVE